MALFARRQGAGQNAVVFLHGFAGHHGAWHGVMDHMPDPAHLIAYDLPGHAASSDFPDAGPPKRAAMAILSDLEDRRVNRAHIVGHSMGGAVAALCALIEPARVSGLTLLAPGGFGPEINHRLLTRYAAAETEAELRPCLEGLFGYLAPVPDGVSEATLAARAAAGQNAILQRIAAGLARDGKQGMLPLDALAAVDIPISVVWGEIDNVLPVRHAHNMPARFQRNIFPHLGHMLPEEAPEAIAALIAKDAGLAT